MKKKKIYSFPRGGFLFEDRFAPRIAVSETAFLPALSVIPLIQHIGAKAYPIVFVGEYVKEGMLVGRGQGPGSANVHATVPGKVVRMVSWKNVDGLSNDALVIRLEGGFEKLGKKEVKYPWDELPTFELIRLIAEYGVVEMDENGKPVVDLLSRLSGRSEPITLVARCVFDDPWLAADRALCNEKLRNVVSGSLIAARASKAARIVFAFSYKEKNFAAKIEAESENLQSQLSSRIPVIAVAVEDRYPQHHTRELTLALRDYEKKENDPLGYLFIMGPSTLAAIHEAVVLRKPVLDRYIAVGGSAVKSPKVLKVRIGARLRDIFEQCGGFDQEPAKIAVGSPLSGRTVLDLDEPVTKTCSAVMALSEKEVGGSARRSCIGCGECRDVCPLGIDPEVLYKRITASPKLSFPSECYGCGCCEAVCPSRLPVCTVIRSAARREQ